MASNQTRKGCVRLTGASVMVAGAILCALVQAVADERKQSNSAVLGARVHSDPTPPAYRIHQVSLIIREDSGHSVNTRAFFKLTFLAYYNEKKKEWDSFDLKTDASSKTIRCSNRLEKETAEKKMEKERHDNLPPRSRELGIWPFEAKVTTTGSIYWLVEKEHLDEVDVEPLQPGKPKTKFLMATVPLSIYSYQKQVVNVRLFSESCRWLRFGNDSNGVTETWLGLTVSPDGQFGVTGLEMFKANMDERPKKVFVDDAFMFFPEAILIGSVRRGLPPRSVTKLKQGKPGTNR
jgi:hypothetical protein